MKINRILSQADQAPYGCCIRGQWRESLLEQRYPPAPVYRKTLGKRALKTASICSEHVLVHLFQVRLIQNLQVLNQTNLKGAASTHQNRFFLHIVHVVMDNSRCGCAEFWWGRLRQSSCSSSMLERTYCKYLTFDWERIESFDYDVTGMTSLPETSLPCFTIRTGLLGGVGPVKKRSRAIKSWKDHNMHRNLDASEITI